VKWERGIEVAKVIHDLTDAMDNQIVNEHNCRMHNSTAACNNMNKFNIMVMDYKKKLLNVLTR
jgi:ubiquitin-protein ligase